MTDQPNKAVEPTLCSCSQGVDAALPAEGQNVRVTLLKDVDSWNGTVRTVTPAGTVYEGKVVEVDAEGFFDMTTSSGETRGFYAKDSTIRLEVFLSESTL